MGRPKKKYDISYKRYSFALNENDPKDLELIRFIEKKQSENEKKAKELNIKLNKTVFFRDCISFYKNGNGVDKGIKELILSILRNAIELIEKL